MGQGLFIKVAQVVAEEFGIDARAGEDHRDHHRQGAEHLGDRGVLRLRPQRHGGANAAGAIKARLIDFAAESYGVAADQIEFRDNQVLIGNQPMPFAELAKQAYFGARVAVLDRLLQDAEDPLGPAKATGPAVLLFRLWRGLLRSDGRHHDRRDEGRRASISSTTSGARSIRRSTSARSRAASCRAWAGSPPRNWSSTRTAGCSPMRRRPTRSRAPPMCRRISASRCCDGANREDTIYRSKAVGEPPLMLAISVFAAIADAIHSLAPGEHACRSTRRRRRRRSCARCRR